MRGNANHRGELRQTTTPISEFTGFVVAALTDSKLTVSHAMTNAEANAMTKIVQPMVI
jgi:hypothetical protein